MRLFDVGGFRRFYFSGYAHGDHRKRSGEGTSVESQEASHALLEQAAIFLIPLIGDQAVSSGPKQPPSDRNLGSFELNLAQVFDDPQVKAREMKIELESRHGPVPGVANPIKYSRTQLEYRKAPPALGEDTEAVLARLLGKAPVEIAGLRQRGVI